MIRQEAINVHLANFLCKLGLWAAAERKQRSKKTPDLILTHPFLGVMLGEAEIGESWSDNGARKKLEKKALKRFKDPQFNYIDFILMIIYPRKLIEEASSLSEHEIPNVLTKYEMGVGLTYRVVHEGPKEECIWYPKPVYPTQIPSVLEDLVKGLLGDTLKPNEIVEEIINLIEIASQYVSNSAKTSEESKNLWLEIARQLEIDVDVLKDKSVGAYLAAKTLFTLIAVSVLIYEIARIRYPSRLPPLLSLSSFHELAKAFKQLSEINYVEVVNTVHDILLKVPSEQTLINILNKLCDTIKDNISVLMRTSWESLAMIYQRLLSETYRKVYATFYTKLPAARLLAELSIEGPQDEVIDPAEGTGSLLLSSFYVRQRLALKPGELEKYMEKPSNEPLIDRISKELLGSTYGMDALRVAVALSCASLTIASLAVPHDRLKLFHTPVGKSRAGSLDLLINCRLLPEELSRRLGTFDLVIMNPPFTRSDRIPTLIGEEPRKDLIEKKLRFGGIELDNLFTAGLAKPFLVLAENLIKENGRIAAVLPTSILNRSSWADIRKGIVKEYTLKYIVVSWAPGTPNFSSDTDLREILIVLKRGKENKPVTIINLLEPIDSLDIRDIIAIAYKVREPEAGEGAVVKVERGETKIVVKIARLDQKDIEKYSDNLYRLIAFLNPELLKWHINLINNCCVKFRELFEVGSVIDHAEGLKIVEGRIEKSYPAVWGSGSRVVAKSVLEDPTHSIIIEDEKKAKIKFWREKQGAKTFFFSELFILRRGGLSTQGVLSFKTKTPVVSNVWWPLKPKDERVQNALPAFLAFMNSTFGFIHLLGERLETGGLYVEYKKEHLMNMPIPDFRKVNPNSLGKITELLKATLPRFDAYLKGMAELEKQLDNWRDAANQAVKKKGSMATRAMLDIIVSEILTELCGVTPPKKLYELVYEDAERLRKIMEHKEKDDEVLAEDIGEVGVKKREKIIPLNKWKKH